MYWDSLKPVPIEKREGASKYSEVVKYVFEFDKPSHASMVNRFCLAPEWIDQRFKGQLVSNVDEIISKYERAGGFRSL
jgi:hypothetical protein